MIGAPTAWKKAKSSAPPAVKTIPIADGVASVEEGPQKKLRIVSPEEF